MAERTPQFFRFWAAKPAPYGETPKTQNAKPKALETLSPENPSPLNGFAEKAYAFGRKPQAP